MHGVDRDYVLERLVRSLAWPTPATDRGEEDPQLLRFLTDFVAPELRSAGLEVTMLEGGGVLGVLRGSSERCLLIVMFGMTHPEGTMEDPWTPRVIEGEAFGFEGIAVVGRGASEQRGPMVAALAAAHLLGSTADRAASSIAYLALPTGETGRHRAVASALPQAPRSDAAIVAVCTDNEIVLGHKGRVDLKVTLHGRAAHSSSPHLGVNAAVGAAELIRSLPELASGPGHSELGPRTVTPTAIRSFPVTVHTVPAHCEVVIDYRLLPGDDPDDAVSALSALGDRLPEHEVEIEVGDLMHPSSVDATAELPVTLAAAVEEVSGRPAALRYMSAATDTGYLVDQGIPAVCFGPGDIARAHTDEDVVALDQVVAAAEILASLGRRWGSQQAGLMKGDVIG